MPEPSGAAPDRSHDREGVGAALALLLTISLAVIGGGLAGFRGTPDPLIVVGVFSLLCCGLITFAIVALTGRLLIRRGWPRAVRGARWASTVVAVLNAAFWILALIQVRRRQPPPPTANALLGTAPRLFSHSRPLTL